jgi:F-type H+-transporting ATPase subunit alpha
MKSEQAALMDKINATGDYNDEIQAALREALKTFKATHTW